MKPKGLRLSTAMRWMLYLSLGVLLASGVSWTTLHYFFVTKTEYATLPSPYEPIALALHGLAAPAFLVIFGALIPTHIQRALKSRKNLNSGLSALCAVTLLITTGYFLYYSGSDDLRGLTSILHLALGLVVAPLLVVHIVKGRSLVARRSSNSNLGVDK